MASKSRLGRGLSGLVAPQPTKDSSMDHDQVQISTNQLVELKIDTIQPNRLQPRQSMREDRLTELAASIRTSGVMQPLVVKKIDADRYELIAGERRWRAAQLAGLDAVPVIVRTATEQEQGTLALVENVQREDLNPIDRAHAMRTLIEQFGLSHQDLAEQLGLSRPAISNTIRLTELEEPVQDLLRKRALSFGHAKVLLGSPAGTARIQLAATASEQQWSVRELERQLQSTYEQNQASGAQAVNPTQQSTDEIRRLTAIADLERRIETALGTRVSLKTSGGGTRGTIEIKFMSLEHFDALLDKFGVQPE